LEEERQKQRGMREKVGEMAVCEAGAAGRWALAVGRQTMAAADGRI